MLSVLHHLPNSSERMVLTFPAEARSTSVLKTQWLIPRVEIITVANEAMNHSNAWHTGVKQYRHVLKQKLFEIGFVTNGYVLFSTSILEMSAGGKRLQNDLLKYSTLPQTWLNSNLDCFLIWPRDLDFPSHFSTTNAFQLWSLACILSLWHSDTSSVQFSAF